MGRKLLETVGFVVGTLFGMLLGSMLMLWISREAFAPPHGWEKSIPITVNQTTYQCRTPIYEEKK